MTANINSMAYVGATPWHGLGNRLTENAPLEAWISEAGFDWTVEASPAYYRAGDQALCTPEVQVFFRSDQPTVILGSGSEQFKPAQPREFLEFLYQFGQETDAQVHTAGILGEGKKFWVLIKNNGEREVISGDGPTEDFILGASANDGSMASKFKPCRTRVVCQNTLTMALGEDLGALSITHRSRINWDNVRSWLSRERADFGLYGDVMATLAQIPIDADQAVDFSRELIAPDWKPEKGEKRPRSFNRFLDTLQHGVGQREAGRNAYGLVNAVTRYVDHDKVARGQDSRLNAAWFGAGASLKNQAMDLLLKNCVEKWGERSRLQPVLAETKYKELLAA